MVWPGVRFKLKDYEQRAIRLGLAVLLACFIGYGVILPGEGIHVKYRKPFSQACKWAAITCVVVSLPVIGKVAQTGVERIVGTIAGGWLGFAVYVTGRQYWDEFSDGIILSLAACIVASSSVFIAQKFKLDNSAKLFALTFLLVTFGSSDVDSSQGALILTITRISGICAGVILSEIMAVLVFPRSATSEALTHMRTAMKKLTELNAMAWQRGPLLGGPDNGKGPREGAQEDRGQNNAQAHSPSGKHPEGYEPLPDRPTPGAWAMDIKKRQEQLEAEAEKALMDTYNALNKVQDSIVPARSEVYIGKLRQQLCFLPGFPWLQMGVWVLPEPQLQALATSVRRTARLLWTVHLSFQEGFDENMLAMLHQQYPPTLLPQLFEACQGALSDMLAAFPNSPTAPAMHLHCFVTGVEGLLRVSDYQRRRIMRHMKAWRVSDAPVMQSQPSEQASTVPSLMPTHRRSITPLGRSAPADAPYMRTYTTRPSLRRASVATTSRQTSRAASSENPVEVRIQVDPDPQDESSLDQQPRSYAAAAAGRDESARQQGESANGIAVDLEVKGTGYADGQAGRNSMSKESTGDESARVSTDSAGLASRLSVKSLRAHSNLKPLESPFRSQQSGRPEDDSAHRPTNSAHRPADSASLPQAADSSSRPGDDSAYRINESSGAPAATIWKQGTRVVKDDYTGSPTAALSDLPEGLHISIISSPSSSDAANKLVIEQVATSTANGGHAESADQQFSQQSSQEPCQLAQLNFHLQRVHSDDLIEFPETADGYVSQVRWYSFQFLMEELAEELEEMHAILGDVLTHLPQPLVLE